MVAQRKAVTKATRTTTTPRRRAVAAGQPQQVASSGGDVDPSRELQDIAALHQLQRLQAMRADVLTWLAEIERRIAALERD